MSGIDPDHAHARALELAPEPFFWDGADDLAPFGSDEGYTALEEYRAWRRENPEAPLIDCLAWTVESVSEIPFSAYDDSVLSPERIASQLADPGFDDRQYIYTLDVSVVATGFGQLVDDGRIDAEAKPTIARALRRQQLMARALTDWPFAEVYLRNLDVLQRILDDA